MSRVFASFNFPNMEKIRKIAKFNLAKINPIKALYLLKITQIIWTRRYFQDKTMSQAKRHESSEEMMLDVNGLGWWVRLLI